MFPLTALYYVFIVVVCFQALYYFALFSRFAFSKEKESTPEKIAISVIICAKNEAENLKTFLPSIINQNYPDFEIILINDASSDDTLDIMQQFSEEHNRIKVVDVKNNEAFWGSKKYALTLGIKASKNNHLLFTDGDCQAVSNNWITEMSTCFSNQKTIVLGYGAYSKTKNSLLNKLIRFETLLTAMQYFSFAKIGMPFMGVGRNLAYTKESFFNSNGFMQHMHISSGDDDLFINQIANSQNTRICVSKESFTVSKPKKKLGDWFAQKRRHITTAKHYKTKHKVLLTLFYVSQLLFWVCGILLLAFLFNWKIVLYLITFRILIQYIIVAFTAKKLNERDLIIFTPFLDFFLVVFQLTIFISNIISKPKQWK